MKIVRQQDFKDCGVCSLKSIILYYGGFVPTEKIRLDTNTSKSGTTAYHLINAAKKYGFDSYGVKITANEFLKRNIVLPAIAHLKMPNGYNHFVVIYKINNKKITIMDPAYGKKVMKITEFLKIWTNILILFHPKTKILKYSKEKKLSSLFLNIYNKEKKLIIKIIIISIFFTLFSILTNYYFKAGMTFLTEFKNINSLSLVVILFLIITIFKLLLQYIRSYLENYLNKNIDVFIFSDFIKHIFNLPLNIIQNRSVGEVMTRVTELDNLKTLFTEVFIGIFLDSILGASSMILLYMINKKLFLILCLSLVIYIVIGIIYNKINYRKIMQNIEYETNFNTTLIENLNMYPSIKNLNTTTLNLDVMEKDLVRYLKDNFLLKKFFDKQVFLKNFINELTHFLVTTVGLYLIKNNSLILIDLITFNSLMAFFMDPIKNMIDLLPKISFLKASFIKINDFLINKPEAIEEKCDKLVNGKIEVNNLSYTYNSYNHILNNLNFSIKNNEHIFLQGASGSGKSTVCKLIYRLIENQKGNILIGGVNISDYSLSTIRDNITYVNQEENIFFGTIKQNILFNRDIKSEDLYKVCKICELESIVMKRPLRFETTISNDTSSISGGEKQRIILARALLKKSKIIILDEALSEVDYKLESKIIKNILKSYADKTIIYISHKDHRSLFNRTIRVDNG